MCSSLELALDSYKTFTLANEDIKNLSVDELEKSLQRVRLSSEAVVKTSRSLCGTLHFLLHGNPEAIRQTEEAIHLIVSKTSNTSMNSSVSMTSNSSMNSNVSNKVTISFDIPTRTRGIVVGKRGSRVRSIKRQYNVGITIEHKRLRKRMKVYDYHESDQLRLVEKDSCVSDLVQFNPSVKVTIEGTVRGCIAAKALILEIAGNEVEELFHIPSKRFFFKARTLVKESFETVSVTHIKVFEGARITDLNIMAVRGPRAAMNAAVERFHSIEDRFHITIAIPTALKDRTEKFSHRTDIFSQGSFNDDMEELHEVWGDESVVILTQEKIIEEISSFSKMRLTLADLHNGDIAHVRAILSLDEVTDKFKYGMGCVYTSYAEKTREKIHFIDFYSQDREDVAKAVDKFKTLIQSVSPNDLFIIHDEDLLRKLGVLKSTYSLDEQPDDSVEFQVMRDSVAFYRTHFGKILHSESGDIDDVIMTGVEHIKRMVKRKSIIALEVPSMSQPILRVSHLSDITPGVRILFYKNGLEEEKDKITLCGDHEPVARAREFIRDILECEKKHPLYTQVIEVPSLFANVITHEDLIANENGIRKYKLDFGIALHVSRKNGLLRQKTWHTTISDMSLVTLTGNKFYVEASKKIIEEDLGKFLKQMFSLSTEIEREFLSRVVGRNFRHIKHLERVHEVKIALPHESPTHTYLFRSSKSENTLDQVNIRGASEKLVLDAKDELTRILDSKKKNTKTTTLRVPGKFAEFLRGLKYCKLPGVCLGVDLIIHDKYNDEFVNVDILGCSPDFEDAVGWINFLVVQDTNEENETN